MADLTKAPEIRLAEFLREYVRSRTTQVRKVSEYDKAGAVLWFYSIPDTSDVVSIAHGAAQDDKGDTSTALWLEVRQQNLPPAPKPDDELRPWLNEAALERDGSEVPALMTRAQIVKRTAEDDGEQLVEETLDDNPGIRDLYSRFAEQRRAWAASCEEQIVARDLYDRLYRMHTQLVREGEFVELRVGLGLIDWPKSNSRGAQVHRHAVTVSASLTFDAKRGILRVEAPEEGAEVALETDMFDASILPAKDQREEVEAALLGLQTEDRVWDRAGIDQVLQQWGRLLNSRSEWNPGLKPVEAAGDGEAPMISFAPALILRKRGDASMVRLYDRMAGAIAESIEETGSAPKGWSALVQPQDDRVSSDPDGVAWPTRGDEVFFPLPANREQRDIVEAVQTRRGVLVQGPPGTGKSHTIANLMCHLLASGQRVLVTAENPRALSVLLEKLPVELRPLCVNVLGQGGASFSDLDATIQRIAAKQNNWSERRSEERIAGLRSELDRVRGRADEVERDFRDLVFGEAVRHEPAPGYSGQPADLVKRVERERAEYGWLKLPGEADSDAPLASEDLVEWHGLRQRSAEFEDAQVARRLPETTSLPSRLELEDWFKEEADAQADFVNRGGQEADHKVERWTRLPGNQLASISERLRQVVEGWSAIGQVGWRRTAAMALLGGDGATQWRSALPSMSRIVEILEAVERDLGTSEVVLPENRDRRVLMNDARIVLEHLESGGKWKKLFGVPKEVKGREYFLTEASVDGSPADEAFEFRLILFELKRRQLIEDAVAALPDSSGLVLGGSRFAEGESIRGVLAELQALQALIEQDATLREEVSSALSLSLEPTWLCEGGAAWAVEVGRATALRRKQLATAAIDGAVAELDYLASGSDVHPVAGQLADALQKRNPAAWQIALNELERVSAVRAQWQRMAQLYGGVQQTLPSLLELIEEDAEANWQSRLESFNDAWRWAFTERWLRKFGEPGAVDDLERERRWLAQKDSDLLEQLAAEYAWAGFFKRLTPDEDSSLKAWLQAVKKIGKGTGRSARVERLRRDARKHMAACRDAIPVWIMPRYLVAEMIEPEPERFDTVIVDEASQMGVNGLFVFFLAKRTIIVGDDQQVSPADVGVREEDLQQLRRDHIPDVDKTVVYNKGASVYEQAELCFRQTLSLREHFRCMPEIIQFSNDLCYAPRGAPLDPLRTFGRDRLEPLKVEYVAGGAREGKTQPKNAVEAKAVVQRIKQCIEDPAYRELSDGVERKMSFGVISLVGSAQARLIESMLLDALGPKVYEERQILCGDSATFQGDERDVIFLSMVVARGETRIQALTTQLYQQRFNVAASRARDQMWLFHSVDAADLKPGCFRRRLIEFMRSPARVQLEAGEREKCESPFEEEVYDRIHARGYYVVTQVAAGDGTTYPYRIDMVIEGLRGNKLAVECDGSRYHGPEREEEDQARQRDLERVGWEFIRIPGSAFYRDKDAAMEPLWRALEERGIVPRGAEEEASLESVVVSSRVDTYAAGESSAGSDGSHAVGVDLGEDAVDEPSVAGEEDSDSVSFHTAPNAPTSSAWRYEVQDEGEDWNPPAEPRSVPDPREADTRTVARYIAEIVEALGPMPCDAVFREYRERSPVNRRGRVVEEALQRGLTCAIRAKLVIKEAEPGSEAWGGVLRSPGTPHVVIRRSHHRRFEDIAPSEWAARMRIEIEKHAGALTFEVADEIQRRVLNEAGHSMNATRQQMMETAWTLATDLRLPDKGGG